MTPAQTRKAKQLAKQVQGFLDVIDAEEGLAVLALIAAAGEIGGRLIRQANAPEAVRRDLLQTLGVLHNHFTGAPIGPTTAPSEPVPSSVAVVSTAVH